MTRVGRDRALFHSYPATNTRRLERQFDDDVTIETIRVDGLVFPVKVLVSNKPGPQNPVRRTYILDIDASGIGYFL